MTLADKSFNIKTFEDWLNAQQTLPDCTGVIGPNSKKYILPAVKYTTDNHFQVCERCYRLVFFPHTIVRQCFREISGKPQSGRHVCSVNGGSISGYLEATLKSTWKQDASLLLQHARLQSPIPPCPGAVNNTPMRVWYATMAAENEPVTCCESCFHQYVKNTNLFASFKLFANSSSQEAQQCIMSLSHKYHPICTESPTE